MDVTRHRPDSRPGSADNFSGAVWIDAIIASPGASRVRANSVHFAPGARTAWHMHRDGQVLHVTEGTGRAQARGGPLHEIRSGDTVVSVGGEWHWHGAAPHHFMTHIGMSDAGDGIGDTTWGEQVTESEYLADPEGTTPTS